MVTSKDTDGIRGLFEGEISMHIDYPLDKSVAKASEFTRIFTSVVLYILMFLIWSHHYVKNN